MYAVVTRYACAPCTFKCRDEAADTRAQGLNGTENLQHM